MNDSKSTVDAVPEGGTGGADSDLAALRHLAANLRWSWHRPSAEVLAAVPGADPAVHPVVTVDAFAEQPDTASWWDANRAHVRAAAAETAAMEQRLASPDVAYFCPEFGVAAQLRQYSGGLGILAGDHLKAASDLGLGLVAVGLFYRQGFFRQSIVDNAQSERLEEVDPQRVGAVDLGKTVSVSIEGEEVSIRIWELWVGSTRMVLLDTDVETNSTSARAITNQLYAGGRRHRLSQELVLGAGGIRALRALDIDPGVYHLNEGHACFLLLELLAERVEAGRGLQEAIDDVRAATLFTTHTPVPAGIDRFEQGMVGPELEPWVTRAGVSSDTFLEWANLPSDGPDAPFNTAALAFFLCGKVNGVSQLHASVSRQLFSTLPRASGVVGITNGVHARTWVSSPLQTLYDEVLGDGWENGTVEAWSRVGSLDRDRFEAIRAESKAQLIDVVHALTGTRLDDRCILGFARRFATYKRAALLLQDPVGLKASLDAGAQFVFAGKAHPADDEGKAVLSELSRFAESASSQGRIVIVPDYDIDIAQAMYAGCDVWLNNPIRPHEACGTSGEKAALNGVLNFSISDGWWADWYTDGIGWVIPTSDVPDPAERDLAEAKALHKMLCDEVLDRYNGDQAGWWATVQAMLSHLGPLVTAGRMVEEYNRRFYQPIRAGRDTGGEA